MKILFLTENFPPETNAAATRVSERALYWRKWGHQVTILTSNPNFPQGRLHKGWDNSFKVQDMEGMRIVRVPTFISANEGFALRTLDFLSFMATAFWAGLREEKPDVVVSTSPQFFTAVAGWALGALHRVPFVFELGDLWPRSILAVGAMQQSPAIRALEQVELFLYRRSEAVAALTDSFRRDLVGRGIEDDKIAVVLNGVDLDRYAPRARDVELAKEWGLTGKFVLAYVGTHGMAHGLMNVLDAAEKLLDEPRIRFLLVGDGAERKMLIAEAEKRGLDNVIFAPPQPKERMPAVWSLADVALVHLKDSPAFAEVIPSKIFEAMGMGLPILLVAPKGEASAIVEHDGAGIWVPADRPEPFAGAVRTLLQDNAARVGLATQSRKAASLHSREHQAREMLRVLELAVARKGHHAASVRP